MSERPQEFEGKKIFELEKKILDLEASHND